MKLLTQQELLNKVADNYLSMFPQADKKPLFPDLDPDIVQYDTYQILVKLRTPVKLIFVKEILGKYRGLYLYHCSLCDNMVENIVDLRSAYDEDDPIKIKMYRECLQQGINLLENIP